MRASRQTAHTLAVDGIQDDLAYWRTRTDELETTRAKGEWASKILLALRLEDSMPIGSMPIYAPFNAIRQATDGLNGQAEKGRSIQEQIESWISSQHQKNPITLEAKKGRIRAFAEWFGAGKDVSSVNEKVLRDYHGHCWDMIKAREIDDNAGWSKPTARAYFMSLQEFGAWLLDEKILSELRNVRSKSFRFELDRPDNYIFPLEIVRSLLANAPEKTRLYFLLALNCGFLQGDIANLQPEEINWKAGTITKKRQKMKRKKNALQPTWHLWAETIALLKKYRQPGALVLLNDGLKPLTKPGTYDSIADAFGAVARKLNLVEGSFRTFRKVVASVLKPRYHSDHTKYFLAQAERDVLDNYVPPNSNKMAEMSEHLRKTIFAA